MGMRRLLLVILQGICRIDFNCCDLLTQQDLRKLTFQSPLVGAHRRAPSVYVEFMRNIKSG
jgi:hypothetical protein